MHFQSADSLYKQVNRTGQKYTKQELNVCDNVKNIIDFAAEFSGHIKDRLMQRHKETPQ